MGTIYGMTRASTNKQEVSPEIQAGEIRKLCKRYEWAEPTILHEDLGTSGTVKFRHRTMGKWILQNLKAGDTMIVTALDRVGRNMADIMDTVERLRRHGVKLIVMQVMGIDLDTSTDAGFMVMSMLALGAELEHRWIKERTVRAIRRKQELKLFVVRAGFGRRKIKDEIGNGHHWEWDIDQLKIIAEIAERKAQGEKFDGIAADLWVRGVKDHRGLPWGKVRHKEGGLPEHLRSYEARWSMYYRAVSWFHRAKRRGELPPPWGALASQIKEGPRFTPDPKPRKRIKTKGGVVNEKIFWTVEQWREYYELEEDVKLPSPPLGVLT